MSKTISPVLMLNFYTLPQLLKALGGKISAKMLGYIKGLGLIPPPIKISRGEGVIGIHPESVAIHIRRILSGKKDGLTFREMKNRLEAETKQVFSESDYWRNLVKVDENIRAKISVGCLVVGNQPASSFKLSLNDNEMIRIKAEVNTEAIKNDLKGLFRSWDGKTMASLKEIKRKIEQLESADMGDRISKQLSQVKIISEDTYVKARR